jgi:hypothetical protein
VPAVSEIEGRQTVFVAAPDIAELQIGGSFADRSLICHLCAGHACVVPLVIKVDVVCTTTALRSPDGGRPVAVDVVRVRRQLRLGRNGDFFMACPVR